LREKWRPERPGFFRSPGVDTRRHGINRVKWPLWGISPPTFGIRGVPPE
jgi:hypothetical protein